jgi:hypothetical protein
VRRSAQVSSLDKKHEKLDGGELPEGGQVCKSQSRFDSKSEMDRKTWGRVSDFGAKLETYGGMVGGTGKPNPLPQNSFCAVPISMDFHSVLSKV